MQIKFKKLKDEASMLNKEFKDHVEIMQRIRKNKMDIFFTKNPI